MGNPRPSWVVLVAALVFSPGCGDHGPTGPAGPQPGGRLTGAYLLELRPVSEELCGFDVVSFPVSVSSEGMTTYASVQLLLDGGNPLALELELRQVDSAVEGKMGTTGDGVLAEETLQVWVRAVGTGRLTHDGDGRAEVASGDLRGYHAIGYPDDPEGSLGACTGANHRFALLKR